MITQAELKRLQAAQPKHDLGLHYTIGGYTEQIVHQQLERERLRKLDEGQQAMQKALAEMRYEQALKTREGLAKAQFNSKTQEVTP